MTLGALKPIALIATLLALPAAAIPQNTPPQKPVNTGNRVISGVVLSAKTGLPLGDAEVSLTDVATNTLVATLRTPESGQFLFPHLADGKYSLRGSHRGYINAIFEEHAGYSTAIVTGPGQVTTSLKLTLPPQGVIFGTVSEDTGDPVPKSRVALYRVERSGIERTVRAGDTTTDNLGNYEFPNLSPGNYYLAVIAIPWYAARPQPPGQPGNNAPRSPLDVAYPITYYAGVTDSSSATPIPVAAGERIPVNFAMHPVPAVRLFVQIPKSAGNHVISFPQVRQDVFGSTEMASPSSAGYLDAPPGAAFATFEINGLAPGHYEVELGSNRGSSGRVASLDAASASESVDLTAVGQSLPDITGKLLMPASETGALPKDLNIGLKPREGDSWSNARVEPDGSFRLQAVRPGTYDVQVNSPGVNYAVTHLIAKGAKAAGSALTVAGDPVELSLAVAQSTTSVNGFARLEGKPAPGVFVLLVPAHFTADGQLPETDQSDSDGSFTFFNVLPGNYTLIAIQEGWTLDWARPEVLNSYLAKGQKVAIPPQVKEINLKDPIETQPK